MTCPPARLRGRALMLEEVVDGMLDADQARTRDVMLMSRNAVDAPATAALRAAASAW